MKTSLALTILFGFICLLWGVGCETGADLESEAIYGERVQHSGDDGGGGGYETNEYLVNGKDPGHPGYVIDGHTYVFWSALNELKIPNEYHTYDGGFFVIEGRIVKATYVDDQVYLKWSDLSRNSDGSTRIKASKTDNGIWNFTLMASTEFFANRTSWTFPLKGGSKVISNFGETRKCDKSTPGDCKYDKNGNLIQRYHAGVDLQADVGEPVLAMTYGTVLLSGYFAIGTDSVVVKNTDDTFAHYAEIRTIVKKDQIVKQGQVIGYVKKNSFGTSMLHMEAYMGTTEGRIYNYNPGEVTYKYVEKNRYYNRRSDLVNPTSITMLTVVN